MGLEAITFDVADNVATITLDRPEALNSFTDGMAADIQWAWETVRDTDDIQSALDSESVGKPIAARIVRGGKVIEVNIIVGERPRRDD
jgi:1,4-dihydroxy-2-naphthoyl-CoA synthase